MQYRNLTLIGTSHIAAESVAEVEHAIQAGQPGIVALELDRARLFALLHPSRARPGWRDIRHIGIKGWLFSIIGAWVERKLGEQVGVKPGSEMLVAVQAARKAGAQLALVDQDIAVTLQRFSQALTWTEKWRMLVDFIKGLVFRKSEFAFDLSTVPSQKLVARMIAQVKRRYPNIYRVLVTERNHVMAHRLAHLILQHPGTRIVAVVGAGHEKELIGLIKGHVRQHEAE